jgi:hypothetical protein
MQGLRQSTHDVGLGFIHEPGGLVIEHLFLKMTCKNVLEMSSRLTGHCLLAAIVSTVRIVPGLITDTSLSEINARALGEPTDDPTRLILVKAAICMKL